MTPRSLHRDERGINRSVLFVVILLAVLGITIIDGGAIMLGKLQLQDLADLAASDAANIYDKSRSRSDACAAAEGVLEERDPKVSIVGGCSSKESKFFVSSDSGVVSIVVRKDVTTFVVGRIDALKPWTQLEATGKGSAGVF